MWRRDCLYFPWSPVYNLYDIFSTLKVRFLLCLASCLFGCCTFHVGLHSSTSGLIRLLKTKAKYLRASLNYYHLNRLIQSCYFEFRATAKLKALLSSPGLERTFHTSTFPCLHLGSSLCTCLSHASLP